MNINGFSNVTGNQGTSTAKSSAKSGSVKEDKSTTTNTKAEDSAAVYESDHADKSTNNKVYKTDTATVERLKAEAEKKTEQFRHLVEKMLLKQGQTLTDATDIYQLLREGKLDVDPATSNQAQKDIAADGYWGVEQTSDRMVSFAKALAGSDPSKADEMIDAFKKGFEEATKSWGGTLPDICQQTYDVTLKKLDEWKNSTSE